MTKSRVLGCWTCRLRHKKCDNVRPVCGVCKGLDIACHFSSEKPGWMTSADKRRDMMNKIKIDIKKNTLGRKEKSHAAGVSQRHQGQLVLNFDHDISESHHGYEQATRSPGVHSALAAGSVGPMDASNMPATKPLSTRRDKDLSALDLFDRHNMNPSTSTFGAHDFAYETDFIMKYLDYIFPFLFPFYQPSIFETGRSWLLSLLRHSRIVLHSTLSLTSYFFTHALTDAYGAAYADCIDQLWTRLGHETDILFEITHDDMLALRTPNQDSTTRDKVYAMESIIQILVFEIVVGKSADWTLHLTPALALFEELFPQKVEVESKMHTMLISIGPPTWYKLENNTYIWSPDQAGFRFFAALLVYIDILASTALRKEPRLAALHDDLLDANDDGAPILGFNQIRLAGIVGCQNSVLLAIGHIAALDRWKVSMSGTSCYSQSELYERASSIAIALGTTQTLLGASRARKSDQHSPHLAFQSYAVRATTPSPYAMTTSIWVYAAQIYLSVVVSGFDWSKASTRVMVSNVLQLVQSVPSNQFRTLAWPLCVAGCLASPSQEEDFRKIFATRSDLEMIGSPKEAFRVMEKVWKSRPNIDGKSWDLASCFTILGEPVLLI